MPCSSTLRQIWIIVEQMQTKILLELSDSELVYRIQTQLEAQVFLTVAELNTADNYIRSRIPLIRALAENRMAIA